MEEKGEPSNLKEGGKSDVEELLGRLNLHEEEADEFVWEEEAPDPEAKAKWLAIAKVHTSRGLALVLYMLTCDVHGTRQKR
jgi:hypothetical protein